MHGGGRSLLQTVLCKLKHETRASFPRATAPCNGGGRSLLQTVLCKPKHETRASFPRATAPCNGGESGIRTHVRVSPKHAFQACAFSHSAISPQPHSALFSISGPVCSLVRTRRLKPEESERHQNSMENHVWTWKACNGMRAPSVRLEPMGQASWMGKNHKSSCQK